MNQDYQNKAIINNIKHVRIFRFFNNKIINFFVKNNLKKRSKTYKKISNVSYCHIRISHGCVGNCSFCNLKKSMEPLKSKPIYQIVNEVKTAVNKGDKNILLIAEDVGSYGLDISKTLPELLEEIINISEDFKISISGLSLRWLVKYIDKLEKIIKTKKIVFINIPFHSGSSRILKLMNLFSEFEKVEDGILRIKTSFPKIFLEAQILVGFPTETEEDFKNTLKIFKKIQFNRCHIYKYRRKCGTEAKNLMPQVSFFVKSKRTRDAKEFLKSEGYEIIFSNRRVLVANRHNI